MLLPRVLVEDQDDQGPENRKKKGLTSLPEASSEGTTLLRELLPWQMLACDRAPSKIADLWPSSCCLEKGLRRAFQKQRILIENNASSCVS